MRNHIPFGPLLLVPGEKKKRQSIIPLSSAYSDENCGGSHWLPYKQACVLLAPKDHAGVTRLQSLYAQ